MFLRGHWLVLWSEFHLFVHKIHNFWNFWVQSSGGWPGWPCTRPHGWVGGWAPMGCPPKILIFNVCWLEIGSWIENVKQEFSIWSRALFRHSPFGLWGQIRPPRSLEVVLRPKYQIGPKRVNSSFKWNIRLDFRNSLRISYDIRGHF